MAIVSSGCTVEAVPAQGSIVVRAGQGGVLDDGIRIRRDLARNRVWLLGIDAVSVYDAATRRLIRKVALPGWSVARYTCDPDMVLDASGSAIVSSNVQAKLWRIDANSFAVDEYEIRLLEREGWDVGFGVLAMAGDGTLLAMTSFSDAVWRIDLGRKVARMAGAVGTPLSVCGLSPQFLGNPAPGLDAFTNFVPAAGSVYAVGGASPDNMLAKGGNP